MGIFDAFKRTLPGQQAATAAATGPAAADPTDDAVEAAVAEEIAQNGGGLGGLLNKFGASGLGDIAQSWVAKGENLPVSGPQVKSVLDAGQLANIAKKLGITPEMAADKIAMVLPAIIDKLTPDGVVPDPKAVSDKLTGLLKKQL